MDAPGLDLIEQRNLLGELKQEFADSDEREAASVLLRRVRARPDVYRAIADEIDALLGQPVSEHGTPSREDPAPGLAPSAPGPGPAPSPSWVGPQWPPWPPLERGPGATPPAARKHRWPLIVAIGVVGLFVLIALASMAFESADMGDLPYPVCYDVAGRPVPC